MKKFLLMKKFYEKFKLIILYLSILSVKICNCDNWEYKLVHDILKGYDASIRPSLRHNITLNVTFGVALAQLIDVDERNMIITTNCWLNQNWIDHKLKWDPDLYDGIEFIHIPHEKIWKPDILLVNNADSWVRTSSISTNAFVKYNGNVTWLSTVIFKSSCSINVRYFPFDEQSCDMIFASWTFDGYFLDINVNSGEGDLTNYIKNGEWHLVKLTATKYLRNYSCCDYPYPEIYYKLIIRRRPLYYVFNLVFPCLLITLVAFLGFFLPPGSTEKVSIGITTLLSITVFLMLVAESMPPTSEQLPLLGIYYAVTISIVSFSTSMAVVTLHINNKGNKGKKVPRMVKIIFFNYLARILRTQISNRTKLNTKKIAKKNNENSNENLNNITYLYYKYNDQKDLTSAKQSNKKLDIPNLENKKDFNDNQTFNYLKRNSDTKLIKQFKNTIINNKGSAKFKDELMKTSMDSPIEIKLIDKAEGLILEATDDYFHLTGTNIVKSQMNKYDLDDLNENSIYCINGADESLSSSKSSEKKFSPNKLLIKPTTQSTDSKLSIDSKRHDLNHPCSLVYSQNGEPIGNCPMHCMCECSTNSVNSNAQNIMVTLANNSKYKNHKKDNEEISINESLSFHKKYEPYKHRHCSLTTNNNNNNNNNSNNNNNNNNNLHSYLSNSRRNSLSNKYNFENFNSSFLNELEKLLDKQFSPLVRSILNTLDKNEKRLNDKEIHEQIQSEWTDLALVSDHFFCYFFPVMTLVIVLLIFLNSPHVFSQW